MDFRKYVNVSASEITNTPHTHEHTQIYIYNNTHIIYVHIYKHKYIYIYISSFLLCSNVNNKRIKVLNTNYFQQRDLYN